MNGNDDSIYKIVNEFAEELLDLGKPGPMQNDFLDFLYSRLCERTMEIVGAKSVSLFVYSVKGELERVCITGLDEKELSNNHFEKEYYCINDYGLISRAFRNKDKPVYLDDFEIDITGEVKSKQKGIDENETLSLSIINKIFYNRGDGEKIRNLILVSIRGSNRVFAVLRIINIKMNNELDKDGLAKDSELLEMLAGIYSIAIVNAKNKIRSDLLNNIEMLSWNDSDNNLYNNIAEKIIKSKNTYAICIIRIWDEKNNKLEIRGKYSKIDLKIPIDNLPLKVDEGISGEAFLSGKIRNDDQLKVFKYPQWWLANNIKSSMCIPLYWKKDNISFGTISIYTIFPYTYSNSEEMYFKSIANALAHKVKRDYDIRKNSNYDKIISELDECTNKELLYKKVITSLVEMTNYDYGGKITAYRKPQKEESNYDVVKFIVNSKHEIKILNTDPLNKKIRQTLKYIPIYDIFQDYPEYEKIEPLRKMEIKSVLLIPITRNERLYETIVLASKRTSNTVESEQNLNKFYFSSMNILSDFINKISERVAIIREQYEKQTRQRIVDSILSKIDKEDSLIPKSFERCLKYILEEVVNYFQPDFSYISYIPKNSNELQPLHIYSRHSGYNEDNIFVIKMMGTESYTQWRFKNIDEPLIIGQKGITGYVYDKRKGYLWPSKNNRINDRYIYYSKDKVEKCEICIPFVYEYYEDSYTEELRKKEVVIGMLSLVSTSSESHYKEDDKIFLEELGRRIATALINKRFQEATNLFPQIHFGTTNKEEICNKLTEYSSKMLNVEATWVRLIRKGQSDDELEIMSWKDDAVESKGINNLTLKRGTGKSWEEYEKAKDHVRKGNNARIKPNYCDDISSEQTDSNRKKFFEDIHYKSTLIMPIYFKNKVYGVLNVFTKQIILPFTDKDKILLENLGRIGGLLLHNWELMQDIETLLDMSSPICKIDASSHIVTFINKGFQDLFKLEESIKEGILNRTKKCNELMGCKLINSPDCSLQHDWTKDTEYIIKEVYRSGPHSDNTMHVKVNVTPQYEGDKVVSVFERFTDLTESRKELEKHAEKSKEAIYKQYLLIRKFAHAIPQKLEIMLSVCGRINENEKMINKLRNIYSFKDLEDSIIMIGDILDELRRDFDLYKGLKLVTVDLNKLLKEIADDYQKTIKPKYIIKTIIEPNMSTYNCNKENIKKTISELLINAKEAVEEKESFYHNTLSDEEREISLFAYTEANIIIIKVEDNGIGIEEQNRNYIFTPFYSTKGKDRGLGLFNAFSYIRSLNGEMQVFSEPKLGTKIIIKLPINI